MSIYLKYGKSYITLTRNGLDVELKIDPENIYDIKFSNYITEFYTTKNFLYAKEAVIPGNKIRLYQINLCNLKIKKFNYPVNTKLFYYNDNIFTLDFSDTKLKNKNKIIDIKDRNFSNILQQGKRLIYIYKDKFKVLDLKTYQISEYKEKVIQPICLYKNFLIFKKEFKTTLIDFKTSEYQIYKNKIIHCVTDFEDLYIIKINNKNYSILNLTSKNKNIKVSSRGFYLNRFNKIFSFKNDNFIYCRNIPNFFKKCSYKKLNFSIYKDDEIIEIKKTLNLKNPKLSRVYEKDSSNVLPYRGKKKLDDNNLHRGQRKLFLSELDLLSDLLDSADQEITILYIGSAPGIHISLLHSLYPGVNFILVDPNPFDKRLFKFARVINDYFTDEHTAEYSGKIDIFISDIRTTIEDHIEFENSVKENLIQQKKWAQEIKPRIASLFKFRCTFIKEENDQFYPENYSSGPIYLQRWGPYTSSETRLMNLDYNQEQKLDTIHYDNYLFYHNTITRPYARYALTDDNLQFVKGFDSCYDCTSEALSWVRYLSLKNIPKKYRNYSIRKFFDTLTFYIKQPLLCIEKSNHGNFCIKTDEMVKNKMKLNNITKVDF